MLITHFNTLHAADRRMKANGYRRVAGTSHCRLYARRAGFTEVQAIIEETDNGYSVRRVA